MGQRCSFERQIAQELQCNFNTSGETVVDPDCMAWLLENVKEPKYRTGFDRNFWIWEEFDPTCNYLMVADVSRGDGADYSTFHIIKLETLEIVGEYQGKPTLDMFANTLNSVGREYGGCMLVVENNNIGYSVLDKLKEKGYPNVYHSIKASHEFIDSVEAEYRNNSVAGFTTSSKTRPLIIAKFEEFVRNKLIKVYSGRLLNEMRTFIWNNGKAEAMRSYNDDLIMACSIGCWVRDTALVEKLLLEVAAENERTLKDPAPSVFFSGFGASSLDFELAVWTSEMAQSPRRFTSNINFAIDAKFREYDIEIPFPQRDLHVRSGAIEVKQ